MGIDASAVARVVGITTEYVNLRGGIQFLPQQILVLAQGATASTYAADIYRVTSAAEAGRRYGFGSPAHLAAKALFPVSGDGVGSIPVYICPMEDDGSGVAATGKIDVDSAATASGAYRVVINNIRSEAFVATATTTAAQIATGLAAAINAVLDMPVTAAAVTTPGSEAVNLTAKWKGISSNGIYIELDLPGESTDAGFTITQMTGGLVNPDLTDYLPLLGYDRWYSMVLNTLNSDDTDALDALQEEGEARWGTLVRRPFVSFVGNTEATVANATSDTSTRTDDRINCQLVSPASRDLPFVVAARQLAKIVVLANNNPPHDYGSLRVTGLTPGASTSQWTYVERDQAIKAGSSTVEIKSGVVNISDVVTPYAPQGEEPPAYRFVCDIVKLQNIIFNIDLIFNTPEWDGAPLIPDNQATVNPTAKRPKDAKAAIAVMLDSLGDNAIISDPDTAKDGTLASINSQNPKRLDITIPVQLSGNTNIRDIGLMFGFYFGG